MEADDATLERTEPEGLVVFLLRLSPELTTKSRGTRRRFIKRLVDNIRDAFRGEAAPQVVSQWTRILVRTAVPDAAKILARIPGISSFSVVEGQCPAELDAIVSLGTQLFQERVRGKRYAVRAKRTGKHPFTSSDLMRAVGSALNPGATVDLGNPDVEVELEVRDREAFYFSGRTDGVSGLPLGVEGRAVCLLSGGFDSVVAAWLLLKRGVEIDYVFCNLAGEAYERSVVEVAKVLADNWSYGSRPRLHVIDFTAPLNELRATTNPKYWQLLLKRLMYRSAARVAREVGAHGLVTGESIGQVSSQTLSNLAAIDGAVDLPVFRPVVGFDKRDIVDLSRHIGTYELSSRVREYCAIAPGSPVTSSTPGAAAREESKIDLEVLRSAVQDRKVLRLHRITATEMVESYLLVDRIPEGATVVDVRSQPDWDDWHYPGATRHDAWSFNSKSPAIDPGGTYLLYCDAGMQAVVIAEELQRAGIEAYAYRGGTRAMRVRAAELEAT